MNPYGRTPKYQTRVEVTDTSAKSSWYDFILFFQIFAPKNIFDWNLLNPRRWEDSVFEIKKFLELLFSTKNVGDFLLVDHSTKLFVVLFTLIINKLECFAQCQKLLAVLNCQRLFLDMLQFDGQHCLLSEHGWYIKYILARKKRASLFHKRCLYVYNIGSWFTFQNEI